MPTNEDGEYELILGNRQLLSVFFVVIMLFSVFFTVGYMVGRNSGAVTAAGSANPNKDALPEPPDKTSEPPPLPVTPSSTATQRSESDGHAVEFAAEPSRSERNRPEPVKPEPARPAANLHPISGQTYLQLAATNQHEADIMVDVLRKKSFRALAAEIDEKPGTFRVLVGPVTDSTANKMRADLQGSGFPGNAAIRRTF